MLLIDAEWAITPAEKSKYNQTFLKLSPEGGRVTGAAVAPILKQTALPQDQLMKLWDLCDTEKKGAPFFNRSIVFFMSFVIDQITS